MASGFFAHPLRDYFLLMFRSAVIEGVAEEKAGKPFAFETFRLSIFGGHDDPPPLQQAILLRQEYGP
ncbi:hypothetical protein DS843_23955 [Roseomonas genomospecies 6]|uniref:Uncharacterized protein n=1 Tax=Roseomonas genomospecies 6 TaxID=214106 RepID=A0A9W7KQ64_9PROT|nr:hypothetical protein DS843_23955 [Roseomonas genomospecies 6]